MLNSNLQKIFPKEEVCSNVLKSINLDSFVKKSIVESQKDKDGSTIVDIIQDSQLEEIVCPNCSHPEVYHLNCDKNPYKCSRCGIRFNSRTGTIFQGSQLPLSKHYMAIFLQKTSEDITAVELSKILNVSEKTAYEILRKLKFVNKSHYSLTAEKRQAECKRLKLQFNSEKLSENKKLLANINQFMKEDEKLMLFSTVLKEESTSFMSYMGAKRSLLLELIARLPEKFNNYYEPFIGGGSLFFALNMLMNAGVKFDTVDEDT